MHGTNTGYRQALPDLYPPRSRCKAAFPYNKIMLRDLKPLFEYMRRYRWGYLWGLLSVIATNGVWVFFPKVLQAAIDGLAHGVTHRRILMFAGLLVAIALVKGVFLYSQRWILIGISRDLPKTPHAAGVAQRMRAVIDHVHANHGEALRIAALAGMARLSVAQFER